MIAGFRHTGLVVHDIKKSLKFYKDILGLIEWQRAIEQGDYIDAVVGIKNVKLKWVKLKTKDGILVELLQYLSHPTPKKRRHFKSNQIGCSHIALTVKKIDNLFLRLRKAGFTCNNPPRQSPDGKVLVMYCHDPDGIIVELVEVIK